MILQSYTVERLAKKKKRRNESFPGHLRREEQIIDADDSLKNCDMHGPRTLIGYDSTESLVRRRPDVYVLVKKYPKYACTSHAECGVNSPERPTSLVEGDRYSTSIAAAIIEAKWFHYLPIYRQQDLFAGSGWTPGRSTLLNIIKQVEFVVTPFVVYLTNLVRQDIGVGIDDTSCRMLLPKEIPASIVGDAKSQRLAEKVAEARRKGKTVYWPRCGFIRGFIWRLITSSTSESRDIATGRMNSLPRVDAKFKAIAFRVTQVS